MTDAEAWSLKMTELKAETDVTWKRKDEKRTADEEAHLSGVTHQTLCYGIDGVKN